MLPLPCTNCKWESKEQGLRNWWDSQISLTTLNFTSEGRWKWTVLYDRVWLHHFTIFPTVVVFVQDLGGHIMSCLEAENYRAINVYNNIALFSICTDT